MTRSARLALAFALLVVARGASAFSGTGGRVLTQTPWAVR